MRGQFNSYIEHELTDELTPMATDLGVEFRIKHTYKAYGDDILVRVKPTGVQPHIINAFTKHVADTLREKQFINGQRINGVRFSYPTKF